jgi:hypothetical protein
MAFRNVPRDGGAEAVVAYVERNPVVKSLDVEWESLPHEEVKVTDDLVARVARSTHMQLRLERLKIG